MRNFRELFFNLSLFELMMPNIKSHNARERRDEQNSLNETANEEKVR